MNIFVRSCVKMFGMLCICTIAGCTVSSLSPLYTHDKADVIENEQIVGRWTEDGEPRTYEILSDKDKTYVLQVRDSDDDKESIRAFDVHLVNIKDMTIADIYPRLEERKDTTRNYGAAMLAAHAILRIEIKQDSITIWQTQQATLETIGKSDPQTCPMLKTQDDWLVLTGSSEQIKAFFEKYASTKNFWSTPIKLDRVNNE